MGSVRPLDRPVRSLVGGAALASILLACTSNLPTPDVEPSATAPPRPAEAARRWPDPSEIVFVPRRVEGLRGVVDLVVGIRSSCARLTGGELRCWGMLTDATGGPSWSETPRALPELEAAHLFHDAITDDVGLVVDGRVHEMLSRTASYERWAPLDPDATTHAVRVERMRLSGDEQRICALADDRPPVCSTARGSPAGSFGEPTVLSGIRDLVMCMQQVCTIDAAGVVTCNHDRRPELTTGEVVELPGPALEIACGATETCVRLEDGTVHCWSEPVSGAPDLDLLYEGPPRRIPLSHPAVGLDVAFWSACAWSREGRVECWGRAPSPSLEIALQRGTAQSPRRVEWLSDVARVAVGYSHCCALHTSGEVSCWGSNADGQVGAGSRDVPYSTASDTMGH